MRFASFYSNTMDVPRGTGTANPSGAPEFISFELGCVYRSFVSCVIFVDYGLSVSPLSFGYCIV